MRSLERNATTALVGATVAVSFSAIFIRLADATPATVVWLRMALATVLLLPFAVTGFTRGPRLARVQAALMVLAGVLLGGHFLLWTASLGLTSVAASVLLVSVHPLLVAPAARWMLGERVPLFAVAGIALALAGTLVTCLGDLRISSSALAGDGLALGGAVCLAGYLLIGRGVRGSIGVAPYSAAVYAVVALTAVVTAAAQRGVSVPSGRTLLACLALAVVCTIGGHTVYNWALKHVRALAVSTSFLGEPPLAALLALAILGDVPPLATVLGGVLILAGLAISLRSLGSDPRAPEPALE
ncbi:MAG: DMT family transporter [Candidatus Dormibacteraeota bacterium]|nr:DMT family transporter [Candidatus Dormibacteraeota bacterium]